MHHLSSNLYVNWMASVLHSSMARNRRPCWLQGSRLHLRLCSPITRPYVACHRCQLAAAACFPSAAPSAAKRRAAGGSDGGVVGLLLDIQYLLYCDCLHGELRLVCCSAIHLHCGAQQQSSLLGFCVLLCAVCVLGYPHQPHPRPVSMQVPLDSAAGGVQWRLHHKCVTRSVDSTTGVCYPLARLPTPCGVLATHTTALTPDA